MNYKKAVFEVIKDIFICLGVGMLVAFPFILWLFVAYMCQIFY